MNMIETLGTIKFVCFGVAGLFLIAAVVLFFYLNISRVFGDLTGRTARREIENIRSKNTQSGGKSYKPSPVNQARGKLTAKINDNGVVEDYNSGGLGTMFETEKIDSAPNDETTLLQNTHSFDENTTVLGAQNETTVLGTPNETTILSAPNETTILSAPNETTILGTPNETTILSNHAQEQLNDDHVSTLENAIQSNIVMIEDIVFVHTNEIIS